MITDFELINHIHQNSDMGRSSLKNIIEHTTDKQLIKALNNQLDEYERAYTISGNMLFDNDMKPDDARMTSKVMANMSSNFKTLTDDSPSKIAEMVIQGSTMGITKLTKQLNDYNGNNKELLDFANSQIQIEQNNINELKKFL